MIRRSDIQESRPVAIVPQTRVEGRCDAWDRSVTTLPAPRSGDFASRTTPSWGAMIRSDVWGRLAQKGKRSQMNEGESSPDAGSDDSLERVEEATGKAIPDLLHNLCVVVQPAKE